ncbi:MAG: hypothetical protein K6V97_13025 [Actinomycetia bacterium]|nr:hypothetical protein [Actinomycetes bacterium]
MRIIVRFVDRLSGEPVPTPTEQQLDAAADRFVRRVLAILYPSAALRPREPATATDTAG